MPPGLLQRKKANPEFPLRGFIRCAACGRPLTASLSRGKMGVRYGYYRCWNKECGAIQLKAEALEEHFGALLRRVQLVPGRVHMVERALLELWQDLRKGSAQEAAVVKRRITELEQRKKRLVQAYIYDQLIDRATYDEELAGLDESLTFTQLELRDAVIEDFDMEASLGYARSILTNTYKLWESSDADQKRRFQTLIFPQGLTFDGETLGTPVTAYLFSVLGPESIDLAGLVAPSGTSSNTTPRLHPSAFARLEKFLLRVDTFRKQEVAA